MGRQSLTASLTLGDRRKWYASIYGLKSLDNQMFNVYGDFSYRFNDQWRFEVRSTSNEWRGVYYDDLELALGKRIGKQEVMAVWSKSQNRLMFELGSGGF
jgi:hypothetical protein